MIATVLGCYLISVVVFFSLHILLTRFCPMAYSVACMRGECYDTTASTRLNESRKYLMKEFIWPVLIFLGPLSAFYYLVACIAMLIIFLGRGLKRLKRSKNNQFINTIYGMAGFTNDE